MIAPPSAAAPLAGALSIDVEEWFQVENLRDAAPPSTWETLPRRVDGCIDRLLDLLDAHAVRATFFTLGWIAERRPKVVEKIAARGHEIASHGYGHEMLTTLDQLTSGRVICSIGAGWLKPEYVAYDVPFVDDHDERIAHEREVVLLLKELWTHPAPERVTFEGKHVRARELAFNPAPFQKPHPPIWIPGSGSLETIRWVAERRYPFIALPFSLFWQLHRMRGRKVPLISLLLQISNGIWWLTTDYLSAWWWTAAFHSIQYLIIVVMVHIQEQMARTDANPRLHSPLFYGGTFYGLSTIVAGILFFLVPLAYVPLGFGAGQALVMMTVVINLHHFIVDGFIWRTKPMPRGPSATTPQPAVPVAV